MVTYYNRPVLVIDESTLLFKDSGAIQYGYREEDLEVN